MCPALPAMSKSLTVELPRKASYVGWLGGGVRKTLSRLDRPGAMWEEDRGGETEGRLRQGSVVDRRSDRWWGKLL